MTSAVKRKFEVVETPSRFSALHASAIKPGASSSSSSSSALNSLRRGGYNLQQSVSKNNRNKEIIAISRLDNVFSNESTEKYGIVIGAKLCHNGDLLLLRDGRFLSYYQDALTATNPVSSDISVSNNYSAYLDEIDMVVTGNNSDGVRCLTACIGQGSVDIMRVMINSGNGNVLVSEHTVDLLDTNEEVTSITGEDDLTLIGTSSNNIYLIRRDGEKDITVDRLENSTNLFMGLLSSGVKLLGLDGGADASRADVVRLILIGRTDSSQLLGVGSNLMLWSDWKRPGKESLKWSVKLADMLQHSIEACDARGAAAAPPRTPARSTAQRLQVLDAMVLGEGVQQPRTLLLVVLSALNDSPADSTCSLWVHSLSVPVAGAQGASIEGMAVVSAEAHVTPSSCIKPRFCRVESDSGDGRNCYVVWPSVEAMHLCRVDARRLPRPLEGDRSYYSCLRNSILPAKSSTTLCVSASRGGDELSLLQVDGTLLTTKLDSWEFPTGPGLAGVAGSEAAREELLLRLLRAAAAGDFCDENSLAQAIDRLPLGAVQVAVQRVSSGIVDQLPTGEHWGGGEVAAGQYQLIKRLLEDKVLSHGRLVEAVLACTGQSLSARKASRGLLRAHQLLLACSGMCDWMQDRAAYSVDEGVAANSSALEPTFEDTARVEALQLLRQSIEKSVAGLVYGEPAEFYSSRGLTAADVFFAVTSLIASGAMAVAAELEVRRCSLQARGARVLIAAAYGVASLLWTALQTSSQGAGKDDCENCFSSHKEVRRAVVRVLSILREACLLLPKDELLALGVCGEDEERRLVRLQELLLRGFSAEAASQSAASSGGEHMSPQWKAEYQEAKEKSSDLLMSLGFVSAAFVLSMEHFHFEGMLEAVDEDARLDPRMRQFLRDHKRARGTGDHPALTFCLLWYESRRRVPVVLDLGHIDLDQLTHFLQTRPGIAWMHYLSTRDFALAAHFALQSGLAEPSLEAAERVFSVARLCCLLAAEGAAAEAARGVNATADRVAAQLQLVAAQQHIDQRTKDALLRHGSLLPGGDRLAAPAMQEELLSLASESGALLLPVSVFDAALLGRGVDAQRCDVCESFRLALVVLATRSQSGGEDEAGLVTGAVEIWSRALCVDSGLWFDLGRDIGPDGADGAVAEACVERALGQSMLVLLLRAGAGSTPLQFMPREDVLQRAVQLSGLATEELYGARISNYIRAALALYVDYRFEDVR